MKNIFNEAAEDKNKLVLPLHVTCIRNMTREQKMIDNCIKLGLKLRYEFVTTKTRPFTFTAIYVQKLNVMFTAIYV